MAHNKINTVPAELESKRAKYFGWADGMTPARLARAVTALETVIDHEGQRMTKRQFIIRMVRAGWMPRKEEGIPSWLTAPTPYGVGFPRAILRRLSLHVATEYFTILELQGRP